MMQRYIYNGKYVIKTGNTATKQQSATTRRRVTANISQVIYEVKYGDRGCDPLWREWVRDEELYLVDMDTFVEDSIDSSPETLDESNILQQFT